MAQETGWPAGTGDCANFIAGWMTMTAPAKNDSIEEGDGGDDGEQPDDYTPKPGGFSLLRVGPGIKMRFILIPQWIFEKIITGQELEATRE